MSERKPPPIHKCDLEGPPVPLSQRLAAARASAASTSSGGSGGAGSGGRGLFFWIALLCGLASVPCLLVYLIEKFFKQTSKCPRIHPSKRRHP